MSKALGKHIAIQFTEELVGDVAGSSNQHAKYKHYRWYITSTWTGTRMYLYELEMYNGASKIPTEDIISMSGSGHYSTSYSWDRLFDGIVPGREWDANKGLPIWVAIELAAPMAITSFRWYVGSNNRPKDFKLQGSNDGLTWVDMFEGNSPNETGWLDFVIEPPGNEAAFTITGQEEKYLSGPIINKQYIPVSVSRLNKKTILINFGDLNINRFPLVIGALSVSYDSSLGTLNGLGGPVNSFTVDFIPDGLYGLPNLGLEETINTIVVINELVLTKIVYKHVTSAADKIQANLGDLDIELTYVGIVNP